MLQGATATHVASFLIPTFVLRVSMAVRSSPKVAVICSNKLAIPAMAPMVPEPLPLARRRLALLPRCSLEAVTSVVIQIAYRISRGGNCGAEARA